VIAIQGTTLILLSAPWSVRCGRDGNCYLPVGAEALEFLEPVPDEDHFRHGLGLSFGRVNACTFDLRCFGSRGFPVGELPENLVRIGLSQHAAPIPRGLAPHLHPLEEHLRLRGRQLHRYHSRVLPLRLLNQRPYS
jgi:hypothetical protein